jgi:signal transduction histidine kinase
MTSPLKVLLVEDLEDDAVLVLRALRAGGFDLVHRRVCTRDGLVAALVEEDWDVVISDYSMPGFDGPSALRIVRQLKGDLPFLIVSGTVGEELTVQAMKAGANDYVMKGKLARLAASVAREVHEAHERRERRAAEKAADEARRDKRHADAANLAKSRFLANMSHELRTPLNAIIGFSELMEGGVAGAMSDKQIEFVGYVLSSSRHLLALISDILDLSKIDAGKMELHIEPTSLHDMASLVHTSLKPLADKRGVSLSLELPATLPPLAADTIRLKQILYNLLSNAIKFSQHGGLVTLRARALGERIEVAVIDHGIGISREDLPRLFREFEQLGQHTAEQAQGTGLGLALTKRLVEQHGGSIAVESVLGQGSVFTVRLPTSESVARPRPAPQLGRRLLERAPHAARILVVEDDAHSRKLLRELLEFLGHQVIEAGDAQSALACLNEQPALIISDVSIPGGGERLLAQLRHSEQRHVKVLATTAHAMRGDRERLLQLGFDAYMSKPLQARELTSLITSMLDAGVTTH